LPLNSPHAPPRRFTPITIRIIIRCCIMAAHIWYPNNAFHNLAGNQFVDSSIVADHVVIGGEYLASL
jgi:hypothetical protein